MGFFSRLANFFRMRGNALMDKAEDPSMVMDYSYTKQLEQRQQLRRSIADVVTSQKRLEMQYTQIKNQSDKLQQQATDAIALNRDDLARMALQKQQTLQPQIASYEQQLTQLKDQTDKLRMNDQAISQKIDEFRTQKEMVKAQYSAAQAQVRIGEYVTGISQEMGEMNLTMQKAQDKVLTMQSRANAMQSLIESGTLGSGSNSDPLDRELQEAAGKHYVEDQLARLKAQHGQISGSTDG